MTKLVLAGLAAINFVPPVLVLVVAPLARRWRAWREPGE